MSIKRTVAFIPTLFLTSCFFFESAWAPCKSAGKRDFDYYDSEFSLEQSSKLSTSQVYYFTDTLSRTHIFKFFESGFVKYDVAYEREEIDQGLMTKEKRGYYGYFKLENDSILLTLKKCANGEFGMSGYGLLFDDNMNLTLEQSGWGFSSRRPMKLKMQVAEYEGLGDLLY